ncbi:hypothetical protein P280DRAFT_520506 [Massarina eburnea CBS 473.64]|uniref:Uncharacterized protein n=1 Tax=Massarina eburnea CBS 473.64 TaxID=1395130 RepID=A0A6A6RR35_9PLEO|nr:hypothetical protein P280DRAFT_520506 [Massarina eburnea CBS 473.64]
MEGDSFFRHMLFFALLLVASPLVTAWFTAVPLHDQVAVLSDNANEHFPAMRVSRKRNCFPKETPAPKCEIYNNCVPIYWGRRLEHYNVFDNADCFFYSDNTQCTGASLMVMGPQQGDFLPDEHVKSLKCFSRAPRELNVTGSLTTQHGEVIKLYLNDIYSNFPCQNKGSYCIPDTNPCNQVVRPFSVIGDPTSYYHIENGYECAFVAPARPEEYECPYLKPAQVVRGPAAGLVTVPFGNIAYTMCYKSSERT